ncbi:MAG: hypothetical protein QOG01_3459 [Pseudonocardiales bacterium]|jgi:tetratricopeptide (TPR) repeat protein|nr:hypothetical protein [Pseudonocardiales bacterium]
MTPDEAKTVLASVTDSAHLNQWEDVDHLLRPVYDQNLLTGTDQGDAAYLLGVAYLNMGAWDAAQGFLDEASTTASPTNQADVAKRMAEIRRHDAAAGAEVDGVDQSESAAVLAAADDALARGDYDDAYARYWSVYDGHPDAEARAKGALGIATVFAHRGELTEATQYAQYVVGTGHAGPAAGANQLLAWIKDQQGAQTAIEDGTTADEFTHTMDAARSAFFANDYSQARTLYLSIIDSSQIASTEHAKAAFNVGMAELFLGMEPEAREHFEYVVSQGYGDAAGKAQKRLAALDRHDQAEALVAELAD